MEWMIMPLRKYVQFSGRSQRMEFWMWVLFILIVSTILRVIEQLLGIGPVLGSYQNSSIQAGGNGPISGLFGLLIFVPGLAVTVRRLHDINRSGFWLLVPFGTLVIGVGLMISATMSGALVSGFVSLFVAIGAYLLSVVALIVFMCLDGTRGPNRFGSDPKNPDAALKSVFS